MRIRNASVSRGFLLAALFFFLLFPAAVDAAQQMVVDGNVVNVRSGPGQSYERIGQVQSGDTLPYVGKSGDWVEISYGGGTGWIAGWLAHLTGTPSTATQGPGETSDIKIFVDGQQVATDVSPYIDSSSRTMVPLRFIAEGLGASVLWSAEDKSIVIDMQGNSIRLQVGSSVAQKNGENITMDTQPSLKDGRTMVPLRFVSEQLGCGVAWDSATKVVSITPGGNSSPGGGQESPGTTPGTSGTCTITGNVVNVRSGPSLNYAVITQVKEGTVLQVLSQSNGWYRVKTPSGASGWIAGWLAVMDGESGNPATPGEGAPVNLQRTAIAVTDIINVRQGPSEDQALVGQVFRGQELNVIGEQGNWFEVSGDGFAQGWVAGWLVAMKEEPVIPRLGEPLTSRGDEDSAGGNEVQNITCSVQDANRTTVTITAASELDYSSETLSNPARLVIDVFGAKIGSQVKKSISASSGPVSDITSVVRGTRTVRITLEIEESSYPVIEETSDGKGLVVNVCNVPLKGKVIVLDPGHASIQPEGGTDPGGIGYSGLEEEYVVPTMARTAADILTSLGATVILTRTTSTVLSLEERAGLANDYAADVFVAIHANASLSSTMSGTSTYTYTPSDMPASQVQDRNRLAALVQEELLKGLNRENQGVKKEAFSVLRNTSMPAILVETAFLTNPQEEKLLSSEDFQEKAGAAIASGIVRYFIE